MAKTKALTQQEINELGSAERIDKSMRERFEPALEALNTAYDAYIAADETFTDSVEAALAKAAIEVKDAGLAVAGGLESLFKVIQGAVTESDDPDRWEERYRRSVRGFAKSAPKKVFDQLVATPIETLRKITEKITGLGGGEGAIAGGEFVSGKGPERINERVAHQKNMLEAILHYMPKNQNEARDLEEQAALEDRVSPRFEGDYLSWAGNQHNYPIAAPESSSSRTMFLDWVKSLGENGLVRLANAETYAELEKWLDAAPDIGASIDEQMVWTAGLRFGEGGSKDTLVSSLATRDASQIAGPASVRFEKLLSGERPLPDTQATIDKRSGTGEVVNPNDDGRRGAPIGSSAITSTSPGAQPNTPVPTPESSTTPAAEGSIPKSSFEKERDRASLAAQMMEERDPNYVPDSSLPTGGDNDNDDNNNNNGGGGNNNQDTLSNAAIEYIRENFGSVDFFQRKRADEMKIDTNGDGEKDMNIIKYLESTGEQNPDVIWGLFQRTEWFAQNGPSARQFQMDWDRAGGSIDWTPSYDLTSGTWLNTSPDMLEMLEDTYDSLTLEANRLGINTDKTETKNAIMAMAYNAKQLNMTDYEIKNEFITGYNGSFNIQNVQGSGTFQNIKQQLRQNAATYMIKLDDTTLTDYANKIYLGKATYEGITAGHAQAVMDTEPALKVTC
jgi:hypothetical protein